MARDGHPTCSCGECGGRRTRVAPRSQSLTPCMWISDVTRAGHQRMAHQHPRHRRVRQGQPPARERGREHAPPLLVQRHLHRQPLAGRRHRHPVAAVDGQKRRDVELLAGLGAAALARLEQVAVALAVGVVHLGDDAAQLAVGAVAVVHRQRVEHVAEHARVGEQRHPAALEIDAVRVQVGQQVRLDRPPGVAEVVAGADGGERRPVVPECPQPAVELVELVQVDQPHVDRVAEQVSQLRPALVHHVALVEGRPHQAHPIASAARRPDTQPSSWNPQPW